jgi:chitinase
VPCKSNLDPQEFNFETWDNWAKHTSPNPNVKVYIGAPGSKTSAGEGYVDVAALTKIVQSVQAKYSDSFGGVMVWDNDSAFCTSS